MPTLIELTTIAFRLVALGTFLLIIVRCTLDFWRGEGGRGILLLKCLAALLIWFLVSTGMSSVFFGAAAYSANGLSGDGAAGDPRAVFIPLLVIYVAACSGLSYWVLRRTEA